MFSSQFYSLNYEVGDLVILLQSLECSNLCVSVGEVGIIVKIYDKGYDEHQIYDCRLRLKCGGEIDVWFGEIHKLIVEDNE